MQSEKFKMIRAELGKTQKEMAQLLGVSIKAVHSYEQGWRKIPHHAERQMLFLLSKTFTADGRKLLPCWEVVNCSTENQEKCPAKEFNAGDLCWFINGTRCSGKTHSTWEEKMKECRSCQVYKDLFELQEKDTING